MAQPSMRVLPGPPEDNKNNDLGWQTGLTARTGTKSKSALVANRSAASRAKKFAPDRFKSPHKEHGAEKFKRMVEVTKRDNLTREQIVERFHVTKSLASAVRKAARQ